MCNLIQEGQNGGGVFCLLYARGVLRAFQRRQVWSCLMTCGGQLVQMQSCFFGNVIYWRVNGFADHGVYHCGNARVGIAVPLMWSCDVVMLSAEVHRWMGHSY